MSAKRLRWYVYGLCAFLVVFALCYFVAIIRDWSNVAIALKDLIPVALAIPIALLAHAFNRRNSFLQALRELWGRLVPAAHEAVAYTRLENPTSADFIRTDATLASAVDELRAVFKNLPKENDSKGLYPYENLKDIHDVVFGCTSTGIHARKHGNSPESASSDSGRTCILRCLRNSIAPFQQNRRQSTYIENRQYRIS